MVDTNYTKLTFDGSMRGQKVTFNDVVFTTQWAYKFTYRVVLLNHKLGE